MTNTYNSLKKLMYTTLITAATLITGCDTQNQITILANRNLRRHNSDYSIDSEREMKPLRRRFIDACVGNSDETIDNVVALRKGVEAKYDEPQQELWFCSTDKPDGYKHPFFVQCKDAVTYGKKCD